MRHLLKTTAAVMAITLLAPPAYADKYVYYGDSYYNHNSHYRPWRDHGRIYRSYRPHVERTYISNSYYDAPTYREIRCTNSYNPLGMLLGGAAGGIVGNQIGKGRGRTAAVISGAVLGSAIGSGVQQQNCSEEVFQQVPVGVPVGWQSADSGDYYQVTPTRDYRTQGRYCREYQGHATVGGRIQNTYGTACLQPDGSWEVVD